MFRKIEVVAVTHGSSDKSGGNPDPPLDELGREQVKWIVTALAATYRGRSAVVLTSDLLRAKQTGEPMGELFRVEPLEVDWAYNGPMGVGELVELLLPYGASLVVIAGHIPTVQQLYYVMDEDPPALGPGEIHRFQLTIDGGAAALEPLGRLPVRAG